MNSSIISSEENVINDCLDKLNTHREDVAELRLRIAETIYSAKQREKDNFTVWFDNCHFKYNFNIKSARRYIKWYESFLENPKLKRLGLRKVTEAPSLPTVGKSFTTNKGENEDKKVKPSVETQKERNCGLEKNNDGKKITLQDYREMETKAKINEERSERLSKSNIEKDAKIRELSEKLKETENMVTESDYLNIVAESDKLDKFLQKLVEYLETAEKVDLNKVKESIKSVLNGK